MEAVVRPPHSRMGMRGLVYCWNPSAPAQQMVSSRWLINVSTTKGLLVISHVPPISRDIVGKEELLCSWD